MKDINIYKFNDNVNICYSDRKISLPKDYSDAVEAYWNSLLKSGKKFFRGEVFTIKDINCQGENVYINVGQTDYAHFLYTLHRNEFGENDCRVIYTSVLIETSDRRFVIGVMGNETAAPYKLQFIGGGIDKDDINGDMLDLKHNICKEIYEEIGLDIEDKNTVKDFRPYILKDGGKTNFLSAIYRLQLCLGKDELMNMFERYNQGLTLKGISPEISSLLFIDADQNALKNFIDRDFRNKDENLIPTLKAAMGLQSIKESINTY